MARSFVIDDSDSGIGRVAERDRSGQRVCRRRSRAGVLQSHIENLIALVCGIIVYANADRLVGFAGLKYRLTAASRCRDPGITLKLECACLRKIIPLRAATRRTVTRGKIDTNRVHGAAGPADVDGGKTAVFADG